MKSLVSIHLGSFKLNQNFGNGKASGAAEFDFSGNASTSVSISGRFYSDETLFISISGNCRFISYGSADGSNYERIAGIE